MITRNIIITQIADFKNPAPKSVRGLLTLSGQTNLTGFLRVFNVPDSSLPVSMAIKIGDKKYIYTDIDSPDDYTFKVVNAPDSDSIVVVLACIKNGFVQGIASGQNSGSTQKYDELFEELNETELDSLIDAELDKTELQTLAEQEPEPKPEPKPEPTEGGNFYSLIQPQLDELFARFPHFRELEDLVQNTEWIKVNYSDDGSQHYILGKLYDGGVVTHLCYGIPAPSRSTAPPPSLIDYCQWLPLDVASPDGKGYWVMYQNAETGENVRL